MWLQYRPCPRGPQRDEANEGLDRSINFPLFLPSEVAEDFGIHFDNENAEGRITTIPAENQQNESTPFYAREMRFLGGDSTADFI